MQFQYLSLKSSSQNSWLVFKSHLRQHGLESLDSLHPVAQYWELQAGGHRPLHPVSAPSCFSPAAQSGHLGVPPPIALAEQAVGAAARQQQPSQEWGPGLTTPQLGTLLALPPGTWADPALTCWAPPASLLCQQSAFPSTKVTVTHCCFATFSPYFYQLHSLA